MVKKISEAGLKVKEILLNTFEADKRIERLAKDCERYELSQEWDLLESASKEIEYISLVMDFHWSDKSNKYLAAELIIYRISDPNFESMAKVAQDVNRSYEWARYKAIEYYEYIAEKICEVVS